jgi:predicted aldo/keto reductase-like oxidoreductase
MIPRQKFGRTGHQSTRVIFGSWALSKATTAEADGALELLLEYGVNHIDTARIYGRAEELIGPWMAKHRDDFFVATKTRSRSRLGALRDLQRSLERLRVDYIDLWQMHALTNSAGWEKAMGPGGALEALLEARDEGLVQFLGVTGHGTTVPAMHLRSLERFDFDTVLLPYNYVMLQNPQYAVDFHRLVEVCRQRTVAVQTIKSVARWPWDGRPKTHNTYFYEPLVAQKAIDKAVHWSLGLPNSFLVSVGDLSVLPKVLDAANRFEALPTEDEMRTLGEEFAIEPTFASSAQRKGSRKRGPQTWGGRMSRALASLVREGFFAHAEKRTLDDVVTAVAAHGLSTAGNEKKIASALTHRVKQGVLQRSKVSDGWVYWAE